MNKDARKIDVLRDLLKTESYPPMVRDVLEKELRILTEPGTYAVMLADALGEIERLQMVVHERDATIAALVAETKART